MADYWVNLNIETTGHPGTSPGNPFGYSEFYTAISSNISYSDGIFYIQGTWDTTGDLEFLYFTSLRKWVNTAPWIIHTTDSITVDDGIITGGVIQADDSFITNNTVSVFSSYIKADKIYPIDTGLNSRMLEIYGCTLNIAENLYFYADDVTVIIYDSILKCRGVTEFAGGSNYKIVFRNSDTTLNKSDFSLSWNDASDNGTTHYNTKSSLLNFPPYDMVSESALDTPNIGVRPSGSSYYGYDKGLYNTDRVSIGATGVLVTDTTVNFSVDTYEGNAPVEVKFYSNVVMTGVVGYLWDFGDGCTSTEENPTHTYTYAGIFSVILKVTDNNRREYQKVERDLITIFDVFVNGTKKRGIAPFTVKLTATARLPYNYSIDEYVWDFGDGTTETTVVPTTSHTYTDNNSYTILLDFEPLQAE